MASLVSFTLPAGASPMQPRALAGAPSTAAAARQMAPQQGAQESGNWHGIVGGLAATVTAVQLAARRERRRSRVAFTQGRAGGEPISLVKTPKETYEALVEKGVGNANTSTLKNFHSAIMGGFYVGMAGLLSVAISGNMGNPTLSAQKFVFAALFPVNLLLVLQSGAQLFTGNTATMAAGFYEGKIKFGQVLKSWVLSWIGNVIGCGTMALVAWYTGLLTGGTADMAIATVYKKCHYAFMPTLVKAIMCNWLVCMAVYLSSQAKDLTGKMVGIWFPISMFVAIGFEHSVANMFLLPAGWLSGSPLTPWEMITKNLIPVTLGNLIAGSIVIAAGFSFSFGKLGEGK